MASSHNEPPIRRKRKAPDEVITKNVVVLRSSQVCEMDGVVLMPNTTLKMSDIKKNGQFGKLSFTKSMSSTEIERSLQQTFPFLAEPNLRIYSAKAVDGKSKLDFCGQCRIWNGAETNRKITGNRALYIYCKEESNDEHALMAAQLENIQIFGNEENSKHCPLLPAQVENLQISGIASSSDNWDSGFETCGILQDNLSNQRRVPLLNNDVTKSPADGTYDEDISNLDIQLSFPMQEDLEKTYQNYESSDSSIFGVPFEAIPVHSNVESEEAYHSAEQENFHSNVEAEEANYSAEQENLIQKICPSSGPVEGGGNFIITVTEELPDCIDSGYAYFGNSQAVLTKLNKFTFEGIIPAAQQPGVVRVQVFSNTYRFLGETNFQYEDILKRALFQAVQQGPEQMSKLFSLLGQFVWNQSSSFKQNSELSGQATGSGNAVIGDEYKDLAQLFQDMVKWLSEESILPGQSSADVWLKLSKAVYELCKKLDSSGVEQNLRVDQDASPQESEENYFADVENSSCTSSDSASLSDLEDWSQPLKGFISQPSVHETENDMNEKPPLWNKSSSKPQRTDDNILNDDHNAVEDLTLEFELFSEERNPHIRSTLPDGTPMLSDTIVPEVESEESQHQDNETHKTLGMENTEPKNSSLSVCVGSYLQSAMYARPTFQETKESYSFRPLQNGTINHSDSELNMVSTWLLDAVQECEEMDSSFLMPLVCNRSSEYPHPSPNAESTQHSHKAVEGELNESLETPAATTEGFTCKLSIGDNEYVGGGDCSEWNTPLPGSTTAKKSCEKADHNKREDLSQEWALYSEECTSHTLSASQNNDPVLCLDVPALNVENKESPEIKEVAQSPLSNPLWIGTGDSKLNMASPQCSNEIHLGQEWEDSAIMKGFARRFNLCENEDAGKNEPSRWEMSSIEPNKTDGDVEKDVFESVQSRRPEGENKESQLIGGDTRIIDAAENGCTDPVRLLMKKEADVNQSGSFDTPLAAAVRKRHTARTLTEYRADVYKRGGGGWICEDTPLTLAVRKGRIDAVRLLIENGADVNKGRREFKDTPLTLAVRKGRTDIVRLLIENGADVNNGSWNFEDTPLTLAEREGHTDIVRLLIENGADVNSRNWRDIETKPCEPISVRKDIETKPCEPISVRKDIETKPCELISVRKILANMVMDEGPDRIKLKADARDDLPLLPMIDNCTFYVKNADYKSLCGSQFTLHRSDTPLLMELPNVLPPLVEELNADYKSFCRSPFTVHCPDRPLLMGSHTDYETEVIKGLRRRMSEADTKYCSNLSWEMELHTDYETEVIKDLRRRMSEADTKLRDKKTASLPKRSGKKLKTQTEITTPRDVIKEGKFERNSVTSDELGLNHLLLSPRCEQFKPFIMDESPGDHSKTRHDFKPTSKRMDRGTLTAVGNAKRGHCVVVEIAKTHPSVAASIIYGREINEEGCRVGEAFQLAAKDLKDTWDDEEVKAESVQIGSVVKYVQVGDGFVFQGNTKRPRQSQDADKILSDLSSVDGAHRGVEDSAPKYSKILAEESCQWNIFEEGSSVDKLFQLLTNDLEVSLESILALLRADGLRRDVEDAFFNAYILAEGNYEDCTSKELSRFTKVENEAISVFTKLGKLWNFKLNCVENLTLLVPTTVLQLSHVEDTEDVVDGVFVEVAEPFLISGVDDLSKPPYLPICESLSPRDEPKEIPVEAEKLEADPKEVASEDGEAF